jgi:hypothetical protein
MSSIGVGFIFVETLKHVPLGLRIKLQWIDFPSWQKLPALGRNLLNICKPHGSVTTVASWAWKIVYTSCVHKCTWKEGYTIYINISRNKVAFLAHKGAKSHPISKYHPSIQMDRPTKMKNTFRMLPMWLRFKSLTYKMQIRCVTTWVNVLGS